MQNYKYANLRLTPAIALQLVQELFGGHRGERAKIAAEVCRIHRERGGVEPGAINVPAMVHKALKRLQLLGLARNRMYGVWEISTNPAPAPETPAPPKVENDTVYLYYYPAYRELARLARQKVFPCKVGYSGSDPAMRISAQCGTALPEPPTIARTFRTKHPVETERAVHAMLTIRGKRLETAPGAEWFLTNPEEFDAIIASLAKTGKRGGGAR